MGAVGIEDRPQGIRHTKLRQVALDPINHGPEPSLSGHLTLRKGFGQGHNTQRNRDPGLDGQAAGRKLADVTIEAVGGEIDPGQLRRATTHIDHQSRVRALVQQVEAARDGELGFLFRGYDLEIEAGFFGDPLNKSLAICRRAAGLGCDGLQLDHLAAANLFGADLQSRQGAIHGAIGKSARRAKPLPQTDNPRIGFDNPEAPPLGRCNQQSAVIGSKVEGTKAWRRTFRLCPIPRERAGRMVRHRHRPPCFYADVTRTSQLPDILIDHVLRRKPLSCAARHAH